MEYPVSTAAVAERDERLFFVRRGPGGALSECWELPGGKVDAGETPEDALRRELEEELSICAEIHEELGRSTFVHKGREIQLIAYRVTGPFDSAYLNEHEACAWFTVDEALRLANLAPSDRTLLEQLSRS